MTFKTVSKKRKYPAVEEDEGGERDSNILFYNPRVVDISVLLPAIIMQYLYDSV